MAFGQQTMDIPRGASPPTGRFPVFQHQPQGLGAIQTNLPEQLGALHHPLDFRTLLGRFIGRSKAGVIKWVKPGLQEDAPCLGCDLLEEIGDVHVLGLEVSSESRPRVLGL
jgi:hypothetical protein